MVKRKNRELEILSAIVDSIAYNLDLDAVLGQIIEIVYKETLADSIFLYVYDEPLAQVVLRASKNPHHALLGKVSLNLGEGITGWVAEHKKIVEITRNASDDKRFKFFHDIPEDRFEAFLSLPITFQSKLIGVINVQYKKPKKHLKEQIRLLSTIAKQVGGALENARLVGESRALKDALEVRKLIDQAKGILIKRDGLTEPEAYAFLQKLSMRHRKTMKEIAEAVIISRK